MFHILPIAEVFILPFLPVEMWSTILRLLDLKSLLAAARTDKTWMALYVKKFMLDPGLSAKVVRQVPSTKNYASNLKKIVISQPKPTMEFFSDWKTSRTAVKRKAPTKNRRRDNNRFCPYRL
ncbi:hypothetical protein NQ315_001908 [Exocentrus adspersus]|uniref:F-box domain-containing protein n=1 Tax=Exocentrus adspersus TaxID=1586481 RepID=A0AAV8W9Q5_9CUCU|nr:hypothetical protein NQ315_001908 [Exocentrus adspersus]